MFLTILVLAFVSCAVRPLFDTGAMLFVFEPVASVRSTIGMLVLTMAVRLVIQPHPFENVTVSVDEGSMSVCLISLPLAIVLAAILPDLLAIAVFHAVEEVSSVDGAIAQSNWTIRLPLVVVHHLSCYSVVVVCHWATLKVINRTLRHHLLRHQHIAILPLGIVDANSIVIEVDIRLVLVEGSKSILIIIKHLATAFEVISIIIILFDRKLLIIKLRRRLALRIITWIHITSSHVSHHVNVLLERLLNVVLRYSLSYAAFPIRLLSLFVVSASWLRCHAQTCTITHCLLYKKLNIKLYILYWWMYLTLK